KKYQHVLKKSLQSTLRFLLQEQITKASATFYADLKKTIGAFRGGPGDHRLQIDYTQHILAAMLNMLERGVFDY
ncbi:MAG: hypothetical protein KAR07_02515, partial [Spirochaetes bacterium]|nr:hypothetical protein [Spirochaetota bacterium]